MVGAFLARCCEESISLFVGENGTCHQRAAHDGGSTATEDYSKYLKIAVLDGKYHQVVNRVPDGVKRELS